MRSTMRCAEQSSLFPPVLPLAFFTPAWKISLPVVICKQVLGCYQLTVQGLILISCQ